MFDTHLRGLWESHGFQSQKELSLRGLAPGDHFVNRSQGADRVFLGLAVELMQSHIANCHRTRVGPSGLIDLGKSNTTVDQAPVGQCVVCGQRAIPSVIIASLYTSHIG